MRRMRRLAVLGWLGLAGEVVAAALGVSPRPWGLVALAYGVSGMVAVGIMRRRGQAASEIERPMPWGNGELASDVWRAYAADVISLVSALLRTEALFAARVAEITDWQAIDWTTSPLEPLEGRWEWDGDTLVEEAAPTPGSVEHMAQVGSGILIPGHLRLDVLPLPPPMPPVIGDVARPPAFRTELLP